jgi:hypothetical protein
MRCARTHFSRAASSALGFTSGLAVSTFIVALGGRVLAAGPALPSDAIVVSVTQTTSAAGESLVNGVVNIVGAVTSGVDIAGIQFQINGTNTGGEVTSGACGIVWDTTTGPDGDYAISAVVRDSSSNLFASAPVTVTVENAQPQITSVSAGGLTPTSATIAWATNQPSSTQIDYGSSSAYGSSTNPDTTLTTGHSQTLTNLTPATTYHFRVDSQNGIGVLALSSDYVFNTPSSAPTTPASVQPPAPEIGSVTVSALS